MKDRIKAFTLVELLVAMAIIAVLIGLAGYGVTLALRASRDAQREETLDSMRVAIADYLARHNSYPDNADVSYDSGSDAIVVGDEEIPVEGHLVGANVTDSNQTRYCYGKTSSGYALAVQLENGEFYELGSDDSNQCNGSGSDSVKTL